MAEGRLAPLPFESQEQNVSAPISGADFLYQSNRIDTITTPIDPITLQPYLIEPFDFAVHTSEHHPAHPRDNHVLAETSGGDAVRHARIQTVEGLGGTAVMNDVLFNPDHNQGQHRAYHLFFAGPKLPETEREQFEYVTWASTDFVPEKAISLRGGEPEIVDLMPNQIVLLQERIRIQSPTIVGDFLINYLQKQDLSHIENGLIDEFVNSKDRERRRFLGHWLLAQASEVATDPLSSTYKVLRKKGQTNPRLSTKLSNVVQMRLGGIRRRNTMVENWRGKLAA